MSKIPFQLSDDLAVSENYSQSPGVKSDINKLIYNSKNISSNIQTTGEYSYQTSDVFVQFLNNITTFYYSTDAITWNSNAISGISSRYWTNIEYGNNYFVALVSDINGTGSSQFASSTDGITWTAATLSVRRMWSGLAYGRGTFLATSGSEYVSQFVTIRSDMFIRSYDSVTWTTGTLPVVQNWGAPVYGEGKFVVLASLSTTAAYSDDGGFSWTVTTLPVNMSGWSTKYGKDPSGSGGRFVAISSNSTVISSTDAIQWTQSYMPYPSGSQPSRTWSFLEYGNGVFFSASYQYSTGAYSYDGIDWYVSQLPAAIFWTDAVFGNGLFIIASTATTAAYSTNGITWTLEQMPSTAPYSRSLKYGKIINTSNTLSNANLDSNNITFTSNIQKQLDSKPNISSSNITNTNLISANLQENVFVSIRYGQYSAASSTDGIVWTLRTMPSATNWNTAVYGNGLFVTVPHFTTQSASSTNGITWTLSTMSSSLSYPLMTYGGGTFVATSYNSTSVIYSTNGISWQTSTMPLATTWQSLTYGNGTFVAIAQGVTTAASSTNGIAWTTRTMPSAPTWSTLSYGAGVFMALSYASTTAASSTNGIAWTTRTMPAVSSWQSLIYGNGTFVALTVLSTTAATSTDGTTWAIRTMPYIHSTSSIAYSNGLFFSPSDGSTTAAVSTNGITWTITTMPISGDWAATAGSPFKNSISSKYIQGEFVGPITTSTYTVQEYDKYITLNTTAACVLTLPNAGSYPSREITIKQIAAFAVTSAASNVIPLTTNTAGTAVLSGAGKYATIVSNGYFWVVRESN